MDKKVIVLTPHGRRHTVNVTANTTILQILEMTCEKFGFNSEEFCLKHHRKEVGLTQMFRFSGLPNNCLLEMEPTEQRRELKEVDICLQLEDGQRVQGQYLPTKSLLEVVEDLGKESLDACESPVVLYMRQEIVGMEKLASTTLKNLGITEGRAMIRLMDKNPEELKKQASVYIPPKIKETPMEDDEKHKRISKSRQSGPVGGGFAITKDLVRNLKTPLAQDSGAPNDSKDEKEEPNKKKPAEDSPKEPEKPKYDWGSGTGHSVGSSNALSKRSASAASEDVEEEERKEPEFTVIGDRNAILYSLDSAQKDDEDLPDSFFDLTVHDLKLILRDLKKISTGTDEAPLQTAKMREMEHNQQMLQKIGLYKNCIIRVQFPDRHVLQGMFNPTDSISTVKKWVAGFLKNSKQSFHLYTIPPKTILPLEETLLDLDLVPNALLHFLFDEETKGEQHVYVKSEYMGQLTSANGALFAAQKFRNINKNRPGTPVDIEPMDIDDQPSSSRGSPKR